MPVADIVTAGAIADAGTNRQPLSVCASAFATPRAPGLVATTRNSDSLHCVCVSDSNGAEMRWMNDASLACCTVRTA